MKRSDIKPAQLHPEIKKRQIAFGYTSEEINTSLKEMAEKAAELTYSMGDDTPLPPLSEKPQLLFRYFKQRFSQVTNPPIDPIREKLVMSLKINLGYKRNFLYETPEHAKRLHLESPLLEEQDIEKIEKQKIFNVKRIPITFSKAVSGRGISLLSDAVRRLQEKVVEAVKNGVEIIILSDNDISKDKAAIPSLLAVSASSKALLMEKLANKVSVIVETGEARDIHHIACLIGYGAGGVYPYLAFQTIQEMCDSGEFKIPYEAASVNCRKALENGLLKVIARLGISTINSYHGSRLFDTVCLNEDFINEYFHGTPVIVEADGIHEIEESVLKRHDAAFMSEKPALDYGGDLKFKKDRKSVV